MDHKFTVSKVIFWLFILKLDVTAVSLVLAQ